MNQYDEMNLRKISTITEDNGNVYMHITDATPIKIHGTRSLLFKHVSPTRNMMEFDRIVYTALAMSSIVEINFEGTL